MATKKAAPALKNAGQKKAAKKKPAKKASIQSLINDAIADNEVRSALYKNPRAVAKRYGLTDEEGKAMHTLKKSLLASMDSNQIGQLEAVMHLKRWGTCTPQSSTCTPTESTGCRPVIECNPTCVPSRPCNPDGHL